MSAKRTEKAFFEPDQVELIKTHMLAGAPDLEVQRFLITCERTGLDPFSRQIYARVQEQSVKAGNSWGKIKVVVIMTSIDGLRSIAERSGEYGGQTHPEWWGRSDETGKSGWCQVWLGADPQTPEAARVGVYRKGHEHGPTYGVARYLSFVQFTTETTGQGENAKKQKVPTAFWKKMPDVMLSKCAEASALRKAFPLLLSGLFIEEEVRSEDDAAADAAAQAETRPPSDLPPGATWVPGHAPSERGKPTESEPPAPAPERPADPAPPEAPKKGRGAKKEPAAAAPPPPAPKQEAGPFGDEEPPKAPAAPAPSGGWQDYKISQITMQRYAGKTLSELAASDIKALKIGWVDKYAVLTGTDADKKKEAENIVQAFKHHFPQ